MSHSQKGFCPKSGKKFKYLLFRVNSNRWFQANHFCHSYLFFWMGMAILWHFYLSLAHSGTQFYLHYKTNLCFLSLSLSHPCAHPHSNTLTHTLSLDYISKCWAKFAADPFRPFLAAAKRRWKIGAIENVQGYYWPYISFTPPPTLSPNDSLSMSNYSS